MSVMSANLTARVLTAAILIPVMALSALFGPTWFFALLIAILAGSAALEIGDFARLSSAGRALQAALMFTIVLFWGVGLDASASFAQQLCFAVQLFALAFWALALLLIARSQKEAVSARLGASVPMLAAGWCMVLPAGISLVCLHSEGLRDQIILLFVVVWMADTGAYVVGRRVGKRRLAPQTSPGKSVEGLLGGLVAVAIASGIAVWLGRLGGEHPVMLVLFCVLIALLSVLGDLFASMLKRSVGRKESGRLMPGHGGVLDRIDSLTIAAPLFALGLQFTHSG